MLELKRPIVILAAGDFPQHPVPLRMLAEAGTIIALDSAADEYEAHTGKLPDLVIGDGDSISPVLRQKLGKRFVCEAEQDTNDLCKAARYLSVKGINEATILGATGRREDHTLGNIFHLLDLSRLLRLTMVTDYGTFYVPTENDGVRLQVESGAQVSVFNCGAKSLHATGLRWPLADFTELWQGTLNEAVSSNITVEGRGNFLVYVTHHAVTR